MEQKFTIRSMDYINDPAINLDAVFGAIRIKGRRNLLSYRIEYNKSGKINYAGIDQLEPAIHKEMSRFIESKAFNFRESKKAGKNLNF